MACANGTMAVLMPCRASACSKAMTTGLWRGQLNYLAYELRTRYQSTYAALRRVANTSDGAYEAGYAWCVNFEVPANREEKGVIRGRTAQFKYWLRYGDSSSDFSASVGITSNGYNSSLSDWPDTSSSFYWGSRRESGGAHRSHFHTFLPRLRSRLRRNTAWSRLPVPLGKPKRLLSPPAGFLSCGMSPSYARLFLWLCGLPCRTAWLSPGVPVPLRRRARQTLRRAPA